MKTNEVMSSALERIDEDRDAIKEFLEAASASTSKEKFVAIAKILEILQKNTAQSIQVALVVSKNTVNPYKFDEEDKEDLMNELQEVAR